MALLNILCYPDERLHTVAKPVAVVDDRIRRQIDDMLETMYDAKGVGLAATQVEAEGLMAVCIQHEMDHLRGKVFVEYLSLLKRNRIRSKMIKSKRERERDAEL